MSASPLDVIKTKDFKAWMGYIAGLYDRLALVCGTGEEPLYTSVATAFNATDTAIVLADPDTGTWEDVLPQTGEVTISYRQTVTVNTPVAGDTLTLNGIVLTAVSGTPEAYEFDVSSGNDLLIAIAIVNAIGAVTDARIYQRFVALPNTNVVSINLADSLDLNSYNLASSDPSTLTISGSIIGGGERITYRAVASNTITVQERGFNHHIPLAHSIGDTVWLPGSFARIGRRFVENLLGDGIGIILGMGEPRGTVVGDMLNLALDVKSRLNINQAAIEFLLPLFQLMSATIATRASTELTGTPSTGLQPVVDVSTFAIYRNDYLTSEDGLHYGCLVPDSVNKAFWYCYSGLLFSDRVVSAPYTLLATFAIAGAFTKNTSLNRYGTADLSTYTPGYVAARLRARVTVAGTGTAAISVTGQGQHGQVQSGAFTYAPGTYFGRSASCLVTLSAASGTPSLTINNVAFTAGTEWSIGASDTLSAAALADAINNTSNVLVAGLVTAVATNNTVLLTIADSTDTTNYDLVTSNAAMIVLENASGVYGSVGGGEIDQSDQDIALATLTGNLLMTTVGNSVELTNADRDRLHKILNITQTGGTGTFVIETIIDEEVV